MNVNIDHSEASDQWRVIVIEADTGRQIRKKSTRTFFLVTSHVETSESMKG